MNYIPRIYRRELKEIYTLILLSQTKYDQIISHKVGSDERENTFMPVNEKNSLSF